MTSSSRKPHAVIVGASVAGFASACALAQAGWGVTLLERRPDLSRDEGQGLLLQPNGLAALDRLGVLARARERGVEIGTVVMHERGHRGRATYDYRELRHSHAYGLEIRHQALRAALAERAAELEVEPRFGSDLTALTRQGGAMAGVRCGDGFEATGDLVVGADGRGSRTRTALGIPVRQLGRRGVFVLGTVGVEPRTADIHIYCGDGYGDGVSPLPHATYFFDCVTDDNRLAIEARDLDGWREVYLGRVPTAGEFVDAILDWSQLSVVDVRPFWATRRVEPGAVLVGDAAGSVHPHAGQGANLALEDAADLGAALVEHGRSASAPAETLRRFARVRDRKLRRYVLWSLVAAASLDGVNPIWRSVRRASYRTNGIPPVRRLAWRQQAGLG